MRRRFLVELYRRTEADPLDLVDAAAIAETLELDPEAADRIGGELVQAGLAVAPQTGPTFGISMSGIADVERLVSDDSYHPLG